MEMTCGKMSDSLSLYRCSFGRRSHLRLDLLPIYFPASRAKEDRRPVKSSLAAGLRAPAARADYTIAHTGNSPVDCRNNTRLPRVQPTVRPHPADTRWDRRLEDKRRDTLPDRVRNKHKDRGTDCINQYISKCTFMRHI